MTIALIAGTGDLPPLLAARLAEQGTPAVICEMMGFASSVSGDFDRVPFRIETLGTFLQTLKDRGVTQVCMAGAMRRPPVDPTAIDAATAPLVPRLMQAMAKGDDGTLREVVAIFTDNGFEVIGAHHIAPELAPMAGTYTKAMPPDVSQDLAVAVTALAEMARADLGQAMLVRDGRVIAREDDRGTDALLGDFCAALEPSNGQGDPMGSLIEGAVDLAREFSDWLSGQDVTADSLPAQGAFLYKAPKPGQLLLVDMPTIGVRTAMMAAEAGLAGIVIAEAGVLVLDLPQVISVLDAQGMYLLVTP